MLKKAVRTILSDLETTFAVGAAIFLSAVFFYSTFATSGDVDSINKRIDRSNDFHNKEHAAHRADLKAAVDKFDRNQSETNRLLLSILVEARKK